MGANLTDKPCNFCGNLMVGVGHRRMYCDDCNKHQSWRQLKHRYGVTPQDYKELLDKQGGVCAICSEPETTRRNLSVDHCHETGKVRGLLCNRCNSSIGKFEDDSKLLRKAADYLEAA